jgi:hypothetical protein
MSNELFKDTLKRELPKLMRTDSELRLYLLELTRNEYADRLETQDRFNQILEELRQDREIQTRKWEEHNHQWEQHVQEQNYRWLEQNHKWDEYILEQNVRWEEQNVRWEEQEKKWTEQDRKWEANQKELRRLYESQLRFDRTLGAIGARWGMKSERSFRKALAGILEKTFEVQVMNVIEYDETGEVFGRPEQIELDVIIKNGLLLICELKSSMDKSGIYMFERKARFYEKRHQRTANRLIVISPMVDIPAQTAAKTLGIEIFSDSLDLMAL